MDFVKKILHQISRKSEAVSQITFDEDYNVPDARPDVGRMIQKKGEVTITLSPIVTVPFSGVSRRLTQRRSVDFPVPEGPMIPTTSPCLISRLMSSSTTLSLYFFDK